jgi:hypothetical protein
VRNNDNSVAIKSNDEEPGTTNLIIVEGSRTHNFIVQFQKSVDINKIKLYYDFSNLKELKKYIEKQSSTIQQPAIALNTNTETKKETKKEVKKEEAKEETKPEPKKEEVKLSKAEKKRLEREENERLQKEEEARLAKEKEESEKQARMQKERLAKLEQQRMLKEEEENKLTAKREAEKLQKLNQEKALETKKEQEKLAKEQKAIEEKQLAETRKREAEAKAKAQEEEKETKRLELLAKQQAEKEKLDEINKKVAESKERERIAKEQQLAEQKEAKEKELAMQKAKALQLQKEKEEKAIELAKQQELKRQQDAEAKVLAMQKAQAQKTMDSTKKIYSAGGLFNRYPTYFFKDPPLGQKLSSDYYIQTEFDNNKVYADNLMQSSTPSINILSEEVNDVQLELVEVTFGAVNVFYKIKITNNSREDFATGISNVAWYKDPSEVGLYLLPTFLQSQAIQSELKPVYVQDFPFPLIQPNREAYMIISTRAVNTDDNGQFLIQINNRQNTTNLNLTFDGKVYNKALNGESSFKK